MKKWFGLRIKKIAKESEEMSARQRSIECAANNTRVVPPYRIPSQVAISQ